MPRKLPAEPDPLTMHVGEQLTALMHDQGVTNAELARRTGIGKSNLHHWLKQAREGIQPITLDRLVLIAGALGLDVNVILSRRTVSRRGLMMLKDIAARYHLSLHYVSNLARDGYLIPAPAAGAQKLYEPEHVDRVVRERLATWPANQRNRRERLERERRGDR